MSDNVRLSESGGGPAELQRLLSHCGVSRETQRDLQSYAALLVKWQKAFNLVGPGTLKELWTRHILDSLQLLDLAPEAKSWTDLGSGAGLPGMVLAISLKGRPGAQVTLIESNGKKAGFLRHVAAQVNAPAHVLQGRVEDLVPTLTGVEIVTARALASLTQLLDWSEPLLKKGAQALFHKGRDLDKELVNAARCWDFSHEAIPSVVASDSWVLRIRAARRKDVGEFT